MRISRRQFACGIAGAAALGSDTAPASSLVHHSIIEWRIYAQGSVLPPSEILRRHGIRPVSVEQRKNGVAYAIPFASLEARVKAWDQFNADNEWCVILNTGKVALQEVQVYPAGKIFEISL
jgi:hypothetical protein